MKSEILRHHKTAHDDNAFAGQSEFSIKSQECCEKLNVNNELGNVKCSHEHFSEWFFFISVSIYICTSFDT